MNKPLQLGRRSLLTSLAGLSAAQALSFLPRSVRAAEGAKPPKRLILMWMPIGVFADAWWPTGTVDSWQLNTSTMPLAPYKNKLIFLDGVMQAGWGAAGNVGNEHAKGMGMCFTGSKTDAQAGDDFPTGPSIDQPIVSAIGGGTVFPYRYFGVMAGGDSMIGRPFYSGPRKPLTPEQNPSTAFNTLFKNVKPSGAMPAGPDVASLDRKSVIDFVKGDIDRIKAKAPKLAASRLDAHLDGIRALENRLNVIGSLAPPSACTVPKAVTMDGGYSWADQGEPVASAFSDLIGAALNCDLTRVVMFQFCHSNGDNALGLNHHDITHKCFDAPNDEGNYASLTKIDTWFSQRWAYLLKVLDSYVESDGSTLLDNTLVVWATDTTNGRGKVHEAARQPFFLAGGGNFAFKTGRLLKLNNVHHHRLLVSVLNAFGVTSQTWGNLDDGSGPLVGL